ncbi:hypothetical protein [Streptomyces sp. NPDC087512]|uniref:hypothetical protein n=1 Tax=unclassified Streptomyces TaxID=2593676 RepID=UPI0034379788
MNEIGDTMHKFKKVAAVAVMVGGIGLAGAGAASANGGHSFGEPFPGISIDNLQVLQCEQEFDGGTAFAPVTGAVTGDNTQNIGNFCTQASLQD